MLFCLFPALTLFAKTRFWFLRKRRSGGMSEPCRLRRGERYEAHCNERPSKLNPNCTPEKQGKAAAFWEGGATKQKGLCCDDTGLPKNEALPKFFGKEEQWRSGRLIFCSARNRSKRSLLRRKCEKERSFYALLSKKACVATKRSLLRRKSEIMRKFSA